MKSKPAFLLIIFLVIQYFSVTFAQNSSQRINISFNVNYTTTAKMYLNPRSSDEILRNNSVPFEKIVSPSVDVRYNLTDELILGLSTEFMKETSMQPDLMVSTPRGTSYLVVEDGFKLIPIELSAHYLLPFSNDNFRLYMGGGVAYYIGEHIRKFGDVEVSNLRREFAYGIQFSVSSDYMINKYISLRGEMKFRDPEFEVTSRYNKQTVEYQNQRLNLSQSEFISKVNVDGITFSFGVGFHF
ncbi:MAG: OmpW family outer membrane protein [Bacillota bacterium]